jgi:hypothetical protein
MSVQTDIMPPVPVHVKPLSDKGANKDKFDPAWQRWFLQVKFKIDAINQNLYDLSNVVGTGLATKNTDGSWSTTSLLPVGSGGTGLNAVGAGLFLRGTGGTALETRTAAQVLGDIAACPAITATHTSGTAGAATALPATPSGYADVVIAGSVKRVPYYD